MGFFSGVANQLRVNGFVDHLGLALKACQRGSPLVRHHVFAAQKALVGIRASGSHELLDYEGWKKAVGTSVKIALLVGESGNDEVLAEIESIIAQAIAYREAAGGRKSN